MHTTLFDAFASAVERDTPLLSGTALAALARGLDGLVATVHAERVRRGEAAGFTPPVPKPTRTIDDLITEAGLPEIAAWLNTTVNTLRSSGRNVRECRARMIAVAVLRKRGYSYAMIGVVLNRHHSSIMHLAGQIEAAAAADPAIQALLDNLARNPLARIEEIEELPL